MMQRATSSLSPLYEADETAWLEAMAEEAWADGQLTAPELDLLKFVGRRAGLADADIKLIIQRARSTIFNRVRAARRA